ncbi:MAG TPA: hypothetical protein VFR34_10870, partial [Paracoccaceae bacterium]|nr:hypothetical protein [Paracoccaceae bacterium]
MSRPPEPQGEASGLLADRRSRVAAIASAVWLLLVASYVIGFYGLASGPEPPRPLLLAEAVLLLVTAFLPPALFGLAA